MKKTLVALAAATAMCGASAASLTLYGIVDTGFAYNSVDTDGYEAQYRGVGDNKGFRGQGGDSFGMMSGQSSGSRFGMKGEEELGNGLTVGFVLENGFNSDTGALGDDDRLFNRESSLFLEGGFGKVGFGRLSTFANDGGSTGIGGYFSSFGTGQGDVGCQTYMQAYRPSRMDNVVYYKTPNLAGAEVWLLYGMGANGSENESGSDRYYGAAVTYNNGGLSLYGAVDVLNKQTWDNEANAPVTGHGKDQVTVTVAANYDCGFAKSYLGVHWFDNAKSVGGGVDGAWSRMHNNMGDGYRYGDATGWSVMAGVDVPVGGGKVKTSIGYLDASSDAYSSALGKEVDKDFSRFMAAAGYEYYLSKRTTVYAGAGYIQDAVGNTDPRWVQVNAGLKHKF